MGEHARLSPSSAHRWMNCPASVTLSETLYEVEGEIESSSGYAAEGTIAHELAFLKASLHFEQMTTAQYNERLSTWETLVPDLVSRSDMHRHADAYVDLLQKLVDAHPHSQVMLEQKVDPGVPAVWGTTDAAVASPEVLHVVDYKYGMGVRVDAGDNEQLMLYALGSLELLGLVADPETVCLTIHQPRIGHISHHWTTADELRQWRNAVAKPAAKLALSQDAYFAPSEDACRFCPAAGDCRARMEYMTRRDFGNPDALTPAELGELLTQLPDIMAWCKAVDQRALRLAYNDGVTIPGWKVVRSGGRRGITDQDKAIRVLSRKGFPQAKTVRKTLKPLGELERIVGGKTALEALLGPLLAKGEGKESLVPDTDERPAIDATSDAAADFS